MILNRLRLWYYVYECQAGELKGRSCLEHIFALRMLCDYTKKERVKLYVLFIDFSKAYDRISREKLLSILKEQGCGQVMLRVIKVMYNCTKSVFKSAVIIASVDVRQGAPTNCLLIIIYINKMIQMIKGIVREDSFLRTLHALRFMDDTVIVETNRRKCLQKLSVVIDYCYKYGMEINLKKSKCFVINAEEQDKIRHLPYTILHTIYIWGPGLQTLHQRRIRSSYMKQKIKPQLINLLFFVQLILICHLSLRNTYLMLQ